jgi:glycosyltransferase involved in cell wall biosynthesis
MNMGGTATYLANLLDGLEKLGVENQLVIGSVPPGEMEDPVVDRLCVIRIDGLSRKFSLKDFAARREFKKIIRQFQPDIIHSHTFKAGLIARSIGGAIIKSGTQSGGAIKRIHSFHGHHLYDPEFGLFKRSALNFIEKVLAKRTDLFISIGQKVGLELSDVGIGSSESYHSIAPGIKGLHLSDRKEVLIRLELDPSRKRVAWLGRFTKVKRPDRVVELARAFPDLDFLLAGGGDLESQIAQGAPSNLHLLGWQKKEDIWAIADIALATSDSEGMPLSLIEAQMAGIPVVSTNVGSVAEIVEDGVTGKLSSCETRSLRAALADVLVSIERSPAMAVAARLRAEKLFSAEVMASAHRDLYRKLLR